MLPDVHIGQTRVFRHVKCQRFDLKTVKKHPVLLFGMSVSMALIFMHVCVLATRSAALCLTREGRAPLRAWGEPGSLIKLNGSFQSALAELNATV